MEAVTDRVAKWRFERAGAIYVECDTQLPCKEKLLRCFELGQADLKRRFGVASEVLWIPDVFGYWPRLPQIMRASGVKYFFTAKLHGSSATQFPFSSFRWQGPDGSEVLTHLSFHPYNEITQPSGLQFTAENHRRGGVHDEAPTPTGYGDSYGDGDDGGAGAGTGGGPNEPMLKRVRRCRDLAGVPRAEWGRIDGFFERMAERRDEPPVHRGEAYLEYLCGVQTTGGELKRAFRAAVRGLQAWEAAHVVTGGGAIDVQAWKRLTFAQFHDHIPGSSIQRVYDTAIEKLDAIAARGRSGAAAALSGRGTDGSCGFNPLPISLRHRTEAGIVELPLLAGVWPSEAKCVADRVAADVASLRTERCEAAFNDLGEIRRLVIDGEAIAAAAPLAQVWTFADHPNDYDAWDIDRHTLANGTLEPATTEAHVETAVGSASVSFTLPLSAGGSVRVRYTLDAGSPLLRIDLDVEWSAPKRLLKFAFPTDYLGQAARYGVPLRLDASPAAPRAAAPRREVREPRLTRGRRLRRHRARRADGRHAVGLRLRLPPGSAKRVADPLAQKHPAQPRRQPVHPRKSRGDRDVVGPRHTPRFPRRGPIPRRRATGRDARRGGRCPLQRDLGVRRRGAAVGDAHAPRQRKSRARPDQAA